MTVVSQAAASLIVATLALLAPGDAAAQSYPGKPIRLIDPWSPGGGSDLVARPVAARISEALGQQVVIEAKPGANSIIGTDHVARSAPDGYTLLIGSKTITSNASVYKKLPYDTATALTPISMISKTPFYVVVNAALPASNIRELIALAKDKPGRINYASSGIGGAPHLAAELFSMEAGISMTHVPYTGMPPAVQDLVKGDVQVLFTGLSTVSGFVDAGKLKLLAYAGLERAPATPQVPTVAESGIPGFEAGVWYGIFGPAGLPRDITERLSAEIRKAVGSKDIHDRYTAMNVVPTANTPDEFAAIFRNELVRQAAVVKASGASADF